ncbi:hypothetical protein AVEN_181149-1 [Araneus ventricosus]|uniref:Uncharacterized protein n=1 Tax=Araneus ventricosus TaxID=182803 RepID=A0A4Y2KN83_ARAVE|nr:hypothetical protein AVEN_181149-1 [Araneus ventricosus]
MNRITPKLQITSPTNMCRWNSSADSFPLTSSAASRGDAQGGCTCRGRGAMSSGRSGATIEFSRPLHKYSDARTHCCQPQNRFRVSRNFILRTPPSFTA